ncbi:hypothetical protein MADA3029_60172 [Vibrio nigripulchritudo MADA3029]|uniref:hypothetical protein n=1 Tax=Vibrio nigripulchritudo TaxID=28173 RepID=UPI0003B1FA3F|nr:hypothetical protein [Vibrio nigripulchritudo]CCN47125.1 hypothetical protein VIBNIMADA3020_290174 [Vibrio nigripulchritudo MADA3020]CCN51068.1 hypothetical protein VIBNIMADA3021_10175 [Vibrio nigripulchritudo MADA3021]CCN60586.1 hypothetical protein MADA3029_60172 [Vibrio nigripulchritudo MADA3029]
MKIIIYIIIFFFSPLSHSYVIGSGIDTNTIEIKEVCIEGQEIVQGNKHTTLKFHGKRNLENEINNIHGYIKGKVDLILLSGSAKVSMESNTEDDNLRDEFTLDITHIDEHRYLKNIKLNNIGKNASSIGGKKSQYLCGDSFISYLTKGRKLNVKMGLEFSSRKKKELIKLNYKVKLLWFKVAEREKTIRDISRIDSNSVYFIEVESKQDLPDNLKKILNDNPTHCSGADISPCLVTEDLLHQYLTSKNGYMAEENSNEILDFKVSEYSSIGRNNIGQKDSDINKISNDKNSLLSNMLALNKTKLLRLQRLFKVYGDPLMKINLDNAAENETLINSAITRCNSNLETCDLVISNLRNTLKPVLLEF